MATKRRKYERCKSCGGRGRHDNPRDLLGTETCLTCAGRGWIHIPADGELPLADASRRLHRQRRKPRGISALLGAVLCPPSGSSLRLVGGAYRAAQGAGRN